MQPQRHTSPSGERLQAGWSRGRHCHSHDLDVWKPPRNLDPKSRTMNQFLLDLRAVPQLSLQSTPSLSETFPSTQWHFWLLERAEVPQLQAGGGCEGCEEPELRRVGRAEMAGGFWTYPILRFSLNHLKTKHLSIIYVIYLSI